MSHYPSGQPWPLKKTLMVYLFSLSSLLLSLPNSATSLRIAVLVLEMLLLFVRELSVHL